MVKKSGRPKNPSDVDIMLQRYQEIMALAGHERSISQAFRLWHFGQITESQLRACDLIGRIYEAFRGTQGLRPDPISPPVELGGMGGGDERSDDEWLQRCKTARDNWLSLCEILPEKHEHRGARDIIERLCVHNQAVNPVELSVIHRYLNIVAYEYDLGPVPPEISRLAPVRKSKPREKGEKPATRQERFDAGAFAHREPGSAARPSAYHDKGSQGERDHKALVAKLKARQQQMECGA